MIQWGIKTSFSEQKYCCKWKLENFSRILPNTNHSCPKFQLDYGYWFFQLCKNDTSMSIKLSQLCPSRELELEDLELKSQVSVSDSTGIMIYTELKKISRMLRTKELANIDEAYLKKMARAPNDMLIITVDLVLYKIITQNMKQMKKIHYQEKADKLLCKDILRMYENDVQTDVVLNIEGEKINAHKFILCARSPVFANMFQLNMAESAKNIIDIVDVGVDAIKNLVDFMYSRVNFDYDFDTAVNVYYAADKYQVLQLRKTCIKMILRNLNKDNAIQVLLLSDRHKDESLKEAVVEFIVDNFKDCALTDSWIDFASEKSELFNELKTSISSYE